ncbi:very-long-chain 3-oxoacyl-CoA reductase-B-like [Halichondria panicea]|uniref:very-long-chain 3-oxoacyl-CoA reductase-B-like n=1 Tax=Halichondria panicea TaxID=6063 RepID=UPI00312B4353
MDYLREAVELFMSERFCVYRNVAAVVGSLVLLRFTLRFLCNACSWLRAYFLAPLGLGRTNLKKYGPWAVVTGASEGIGRGYALELARQGLNVVLMSRSQEKLDKVATEIKARYAGREVRVVPVDFSQGAEIFPQIAENVQDLDIGILVNNVGLSSEYPEMFLKMSIERMRKMVELNIQALMHMSHVIMPQMVAKGRGLVINLSSSSAIRNTVMLAVYGSTKSFVEFFSTSLSLEYASKGIIVQTVSPFFVATAMSGIRRSNLFVADANHYARSALATVGIMSFTHGTLSHSIQGAVLRFVPVFITGLMMWNVMEGAKAQYLKRLAKRK